MSFPHSTITDLVATTLERRSSTIADNVTNNNAVLAWLKKKGRVKTFSGGRTIYEVLMFAENGNGGWYSGYDTLPTAAADVVSGAEFGIKQYAVPVVMSGLEQIQNSGKEALFDLLDARIQAAEATMANDICVGIYSDGTGSNSKTITGLDAMMPADPTTGTYGGIDRSSSANTFWRSQLNDVGSITSSNVQGEMNDLWALCIRGADTPDLIIAGSTLWAKYMASMQTLQRFASVDAGHLGFQVSKFMGADVVLDTVSGCDADDFYFINTNYVALKVHKDRNMVPLSPEKRYATNQDASVTILAWAGNLTCSNSARQGRGKHD